MILYKTTVQLQGYIEGCSVVVSLSVESNVVFAMLHLVENLSVNTMHNDSNETKAYDWVHIQ